ncbi:MAG: Uncharacterized protein XD63_1671 [Thermoanaerobacterales bacterium 50_218]|nr:MAG: Uncharacterized protein XD63_1671 [Thermoanaerobacterales bacterium 50_218]
MAHQSGETWKEKGGAEGNSSRVNTIVERLRDAQIRSNSPSDFEKALKDAFDFLGFEAELVGGPGDTDVLLTGNIGQESFKVTVDAKTSSSGKISENQINWPSLRDHRQMNQADFVVVVGPDFSGGNLEKRADEYSVCLLKTEELIDLLEAHSRFPFTLTELKDLFKGNGRRTSQLEDLLTQNASRRGFLEQLKVVIEEMQSVQDKLGYFSRDSLAVRERIEELDISPESISHIIELLKLPFINGIQEVPNAEEADKYILTIKMKDIANIFQQIAAFLVEDKAEKGGTACSASGAESENEIPVEEKKLGTKYFDWFVRGNSVVALARKDNPYEHFCPIEHFRTILEKVVEAFKKQNVISALVIFSLLEGQDLSPERPFKGKAEDYKIRVALGILEIEGLIKWTGSKRPIEYMLSVPLEELEDWINSGEWMKKKGEVSLS